MIYFPMGWSRSTGNIALGLSLGILVVACATPKKPVPLERAEAAVERMQRDPEITQYAPVKLEEAQEALQEVQAAWKKGKRGEEIAHLAYLAQQQATLAEVVAAENEAQVQIKKLGEERQQMLMEVRELEAEQAKEQAESSEARVHTLEAERAKMQTEMDRAEARAQELEQRLTELNAKETQRGYVLTLGDILFQVDRAELTPGGMQNLFRLVTFLKEFPKREVAIEGHTDSTGSENYNLELSQRRADAVREFLLNNGIAPERIVARGYGEAYPVAPNNTAAGRQQNRRVEIVILRSGERAKEYQRP